MTDNFDEPVTGSIQLGKASLKIYFALSAI